MQWQDDGVVLARRPMSANKWLVECITVQHGVVRGVVRLAKPQLGMVDKGALVQLTGSARLAEHMPTLTLEPLAQPLLPYLHDGTRLAAVASLCALVGQILPEREPYPVLAQAMMAWLRQLHAPDWLAGCARLEWELLQEAGYALDVSACAVTGATQGLAYISPKSGRAVTAEAASVWRDKLLPLPAFLQDGNARATSEDIVQALRLTQYFLQAWVFATLARPLPLARVHLAAILPQTATDKPCTALENHV